MRPAGRGELTGLGVAVLIAGCLLGRPAMSQDAQRPAGQPTSAPVSLVPVRVFASLLDADEPSALAALQYVDRHWQDSYAALLIELVPFAPGPHVQRGIVALLERRSGQQFGPDLERWYRWLWAQPRSDHPQYAQFKAMLYEPIDPRFREYFVHPRLESAIRLDEVRWGGVRRDGIPPLRDPKMIAAHQATWLQDDHVVFGVALAGDARAYPKRVLGWHEMVKDTVGGRALNGVYCTLCGALVVYDVTVDGVHHELGTSGFLYRSNKLMYDHATKSLWSSLTGRPVVGPLVGKGIELAPLPVVTTTWREWRTRHPKTLVLSLDTGHQRDYSEGAAYRDYFASDRLMFTVPQLDDRLPHKAEVLALRLPSEPGESVAIAADYLASRSVVHLRIGRSDVVVLTDASGANRVYESRHVTFIGWDGAGTARDRQGGSWAVDESQLSGPRGETLRRLPAHRAFWFGWHAAYPETRLIK